MSVLLTSKEYDVARPRLPIGTLGAITVLTLDDGRVEVRTRCRDGDGKTRQVSAGAARQSEVNLLACQHRER